MNIQAKLLLLWLSGFGMGVFIVVADELQALAWNAYYNFPLIGELHKFGGYDQIGAWDLAFIFILGFLISSMIFYGKLVLEWEFLKK